MFPLVSHVNRDDDLIEAWLRHYVRLGLTSFHLVAHGGRSENAAVHALAGRYPIVVEDEYTGAFDPFEKRDRLIRVIGRLGYRWVVVADSDEFLELPYRSVPATVRVLNWLGADTVFAPFVQRLAPGGALDVPAGGSPFEAYPLCSIDLYARLGQPGARTEKYPLFKVTPRTRLRGGGNHHPPQGPSSRIAPIAGVTHHFKWRPSAEARLTARAHSAHPYRSESVQYLAHLRGAGFRLPTGGAFPYSRRELFRRGLLRRATLLDLIRRAWHAAGETATGDDRTWPDRVAEAVARARCRDVVICGAGSGGPLFMDALDRHGIRVALVEDRDATRWGGRLRGIAVCSLDEALAAGHRAFVIASLTYAAPMAARVRARCAELGVEAAVFAPFAHLPEPVEPDALRASGTTRTGGSSHADVALGPVERAR
jgi:hypothetical protein